MTNQEAIERIRTHMYVHALAERGAVYITKALQMAMDALEKQEPIEPIELYDDTKCVEDYNRTLAWKCGKCGYYIGGADNFCPNCGRAVKWDG